MFSSSFSVLYLILYLMLLRIVSQCCSIKLLKDLEKLVFVKLERKARKYKKKSTYVDCTS